MTILHRTKKYQSGASCVCATLVALFLCLACLDGVCRAQSTNPIAINASASKVCKSLRNAEIPASSIRLPTSGAHVSSAKIKRSGSVEFCKLLGEIRAVDPQGQNIQLELNLPTSWNGKAVHFGGAVFNGALGYSNGLKQPTIGLQNESTPLQRGYATFGSDSGHHKHHLFLPDIINVLDGSFGSNDEERRNFSHDALKKTHDVAKALIDIRYGRFPTRTFFLGSSSGGHEALEVVQRWPEDYDGVMSGYPSWNGLELVLQFIRTSQALYAKGGFLSRSSTKLLFRVVLDACDGLDGVRDGLVSNVMACHFNPATLLCSMHPQRGCLSSQQLHTVQTFATEQETVKPVWNGIRSIPGYNVLSGVDLTGTLGFFHHPERRPKILLNSSVYTIGSRVIRYFIVDDQAFDALHFDTATGGRYETELLPDSRGYDASDFDLSHFADHGGKLLLIHGTADAIIPTDSSVMFYERVKASMGEQATEAFMRLYLIPGFGHGTGTFQAGVDALAILDNWLDQGSLATALTVEDKSRRGHGRTRPLCAYPSWPKYDGSGDPQSANNFHCSKN
jgi:Tannase and feruloyl esterase